MTEPGSPVDAPSAADAAVRARDALLRAAAQELVSPMAAILLQIEDALTLVEPGQANLLRRLEKIGRQIERLALRSGMLLDAPRLAGGAFRPDARPVDLAEVVRDVAEVCAPQALHAGRALRVIIPEAILTVSDRIALGQIVDGLLSTAIARGGGAELDVMLVHAGDAARLSVRGIAITAEEQARLYEPFERAIPAGGDIISLWVTRRLAEALGGALLVAAGRGDEGATLVVTLPLNPSGAMPVGNVRSSPPASRHDGPDD
jgi:signal transduction histidine kinase